MGHLLTRVLTFGLAVVFVLPAKPAVSQAFRWQVTVTNNSLLDVNDFEAVFTGTGGTIHNPF